MCCHRFRRRAVGIIRSAILEMTGCKVVGCVRKGSTGLVVLMAYVVRLVICMVIVVLVLLIVVAMRLMGVMLDDWPTSI